MRQGVLGTPVRRAGMADQLEDLLRSCTVRVIGSRSSGAGFFVAPGVVLTCAHVARDSAGLVVRWERDNEPAVEAPVTGQVTILTQRGRPIPALGEDYPDIAVLRVDGLAGHPCAGISTGWPAAGDTFRVFGYPLEGGAVQLTPVRVAYRGTKGVQPTAYLDLAADTIKPGMSGAAVLNLRTGAVCAVVVASKHPAQPDGALAVPMAAISSDLGGILAANRAFHRRDFRWPQALDDAQVHAIGWQYPGPHLRAYLDAAVRVAEEHPYPAPEGRQPPLAVVYVRQRARAVSDSRRRRDTADETLAADGILDWVPSDELLDRGENCFIVAGPGGGKSSFLRTGLIRAAAMWADGEEGKVVPVRVQAADLAADLSLEEAIGAGVRAEVRVAGIRDSWAPEIFAAEPLPGVRWLVLVDGLDELTHLEMRQKVIDKLTRVARRGSQSPFQFIVATRDLPGEEVPHGEGWAEQTYELQPFAAQQLRDMAEVWFSWFALADPCQTADQFIAELARAGLAELARVPLMATMLCQLFAHNPGGSLPGSRGEVYRHFVDLLSRRPYNDTTGGLNTQVRATLDRYGAAATDAGGALLARSPQLIGKLAAARIDGDLRPAVDLLDSWTTSDRPSNVPATQWRSVLAGLLRRSGLLVERAPDLVFFHQTIIEYLAARYVAEDRQRTAQAWRAMFGLWGSWIKMSYGGEDWSYRRFLVAAWAEDPALPAALLRGARYQGIHGWQFIAVLAGDRMRLAPEVVLAATEKLEELAARHSLRDRLLPGWFWSAIPGAGRQSIGLAVAREFSAKRRADAIAALSLLDESSGSALFDAFLADPLVPTGGLWRSVTSETLIPLTDAQTAEVLAAVAARPAESLPWEREMAAERRISAARKLAELGDRRGVEFLAAQAADPELVPWPDRPARALAELGDARGLEFLTAQIANADAKRRLAASTALAELGNQLGVEYLEEQAKQQAEQAAARDREDAASLAAEALASIGNPRGLDWLAELAISPKSDIRESVKAALTLANHHDARGIDLLVEWATHRLPDSELSSSGRRIRYYLRQRDDQLRRISAEALIELDHPCGTAVIKGLKRGERWRNFRTAAAALIPAIPGFLVGTAFEIGLSGGTARTRWLALTVSCLAILGVVLWGAAAIHSRQWMRKSLVSKSAFAPGMPAFLITLAIGSALGYFAAHFWPTTFGMPAIKMWNILNWRLW